MKKFVARMVTLRDRSSGAAIAEIARSDLVEMKAIVRSVRRFAPARQAPA